MDTTTINLEDFTCSICREIFHSPVSLSCPHTYCQSCVLGLKKPITLTSESESIPTSSLRIDSFSHSSHVHQPNQCFVCAICRKESLGYVRYRELENQLDTFETSCPNCSIVFTLSALRKHLEICIPMRSNYTRHNTDSRSTNLVERLSESQTKALQKAQQGENRSTFQCPFCPRANFTLNHLRQHIKKRHKNEDQRRVCPICSTLPWGDKNMISSNIYQHIKSRHRFDYDTYVNYEQDEETMMREALQASLLHQ
ncbi:unnamed protein product [Adineta steineri]|uniref:RING-type E3 ubiquitin transferase n=1 Tax=Adineta steineri TaxID=433720 RepID=A0A815HY01_9BILA|nr:unnamed protein product [Adineta steineri]CAF1296160.1 unnamed protein product [Adineta steineri]CAF1358170.1 unnamed protein product [Adineta steineri]CAF1599409.1 unnamed protein product [Adineta steineri]